MLEAPPVEQFNGRFENIDELITALNDFARGHGYAVVKKNSGKNTNGVENRAYICCDRGRKREVRIDEVNRERQRTYWRIDCPFSAAANLRSGVWAFRVRVPYHNHVGKLDFSKYRITC
jgi:hypothetical protein